MRELLPRAGEELTAEALVARLGLDAGGCPGLPRVVAIMIVSVDGRATIDQGSAKLGHPEDRALLRSLRAEADCLLAGTGTIAAEGYARLLDEGQRAARVSAGRPPHPLVATVSRSGGVPWGVPVFSEPEVEKQVYVGSPVSVPAGVTATSIQETSGGPRAALEHLHAARGVRSVTCEGGPALLRALMADDLVDDLLLTVAPLLVVGDGPSALTGAALDPPVRMGLRAVGRADDHLFLHYAR
ncbi:MAG: dihydrofolate reductase family protein [Actinomycetota bacterium]|nr:dihydrofolate reductase family protein [Actinomycetota bacterium]